MQHGELRAGKHCLRCFLVRVGIVFLNVPFSGRFCAAWAETVVALVVGEAQQLLQQRKAELRKELAGIPLVD